MCMMVMGLAIGLARFMIIYLLTFRRMSKKDNLLKFWESLESNQQTKDVIKPFRPHCQSLKIKSISQNDLIHPRPSIVPSKAQLQGWRGDKTDSIPGVMNEDQGVDDISLAESEKTEIGSLPVIPRNEILTHTTKSRARRTRTHPIRQKNMADQVTTSEDVEMSASPYQTPPAAANEFSNFKHSPTSASFLDKSPLQDLLATSPKPATSIVKPFSAFSTFLSNPLKFTKAQETKSAKKESPAVPKRNLIPSSPKIGTEGTGNKSGCGQHIPGKLKSPYHENSRPKTPKSPITSSKANFNEHRSSSLKSVATSKADISERRVSLKAVTTPYKSLQAAITPIKPEPASLQPITSPRIARLTDSFQVATNSPSSKTAAVRGINLQADTRTQQLETSSSVNSTTLLQARKAATTPSTAGTTSASTATCPSASPPQVTACEQAGREGKMNTEHGLLVKEGASGNDTPGIENQDFNVLMNEINKKVEGLESAVAEEKIARTKLEKDFSELKLIVTKLNLST